MQKNMKLQLRDNDLNQSPKIKKWFYLSIWEYAVLGETKLRKTVNDLLIREQSSQ